MRSSKSRSRSKSNRQRSIGNIINRVFDSSGPEGKVRGTPQQIIEKYLMLARDAQLSNDRVAAEAFLQHAEHYTRMLGEAQRELQREQEQRQGGQNIGGQNFGGGYGGQGQNGNGQNGHGGYQNDRRDQNRDYSSRDDQPVYTGDEPQPEIASQNEADDSGLHRFVSGTVDEDREDDPGLVDTPEQPLEAASHSQRAPRQQGQRPPRNQGAPRGERPRGEGQETTVHQHAAAEGASTEAAQNPKADRPRRAPRKPKAASTENGDTPAVTE